MFYPSFSCSTSSASMDDKENTETGKRSIKINNGLHSCNKKYPNNKIVTHKYTIWNFLPKNLLEQFCRLSNLYFLGMAIIAVTVGSLVTAVTTILPLIFVTSVTALKQGYEDFLLYKQDSRVNRASAKIIRNKCLRETYCERLKVGDIVKISRNQDVPCDMVLLYSSQENNFSCYVTTSNLDGETNLKTLYVPKIMSNVSVGDIVSVDATLTYEAPTDNLHVFHGKLELHKDDQNIGNGHLSIDNLLLRGVKLKDTDFVIGCVIYTGQDTKLSLNSKVGKPKVSTSDRSISKFLIMTVVAMVVMILFSSVRKMIHDLKNPWILAFVQKREVVPYIDLVTNALQFMIIFQHMIPISLPVTIELQKFFGALFFTWDLDMYDEKSDQPAIANTSDLNEELGQVEYLLSDKTGTLTDNEMIFRRCFLDGKAYLEKDCDGLLYALPSDGDDSRAVLLSHWEPNVWHFFISLALCHDVHIASSPSMRAGIFSRRSEYQQSFRRERGIKLRGSLMLNPTLPEYEATSPDEKSLVEASARLGVVLSSDADDVLSIRIKNDVILEYKRLEILEFSSSRKRMSVIVRDATNDIWMYCKGADSSMFPLIETGDVDNAMAHVSAFSKKGMRTLVIGFKKLEEAEYEDIMKRISDARQVIGEDQSDSIEKVYKLVESGLTLLGVSGVEDSLQEGVADTIQSLRDAGIKIWILTGDKAETAENIALSCGHFDDSTEILRLTGLQSEEECYAKLLSFQRIMKLHSEPMNFLIDGTSLALVYERHSELLRSVACLSEAALFARLTPLQKSQIARLLRKGKDNPMTAAIGDGGNDVSMIKEARLGIGIIGKEGRQAAMNSDFAVTKFKHLKKALLVHGHWNYERICTLIFYFIYKSIVFVLPQLFYSFYCAFSAQSLYDATFMTLFNLCFTSLPILMYGLSEQKYSAEELLARPELYKLNRGNSKMSYKRFAICVATGVWHAIVIFFMAVSWWELNPNIMRDSSPGDQASFGIVVFQMVTLVTNFQILVTTSNISVLIVTSCLVSILSYFIVVLVYNVLKIHMDADFYFVFFMLAQSVAFWAMSALILVVAIIPTMLFQIQTEYNVMPVTAKIKALIAKKMKTQKVHTVDCHSEDIAST